jgi:hypothetical protein
LFGTIALLMTTKQAQKEVVMAEVAAVAVVLVDLIWR